MSPPILYSLQFTDLSRRVFDVFSNKYGLDLLKHGSCQNGHDKPDTCVVEIICLGTVELDATPWLPFSDVFSQHLSLWATRENRKSRWGRMTKWCNDLGTVT